MGIRILGIETSCDETAASVVDDGRWVRSNVVASQHDLHRKYQGVVPEIASRAHLERIMPVIEQALTQSNSKIEEIDCLAVGHRPGLIGSLLVGVSAAKAIAWAAGKPFVGVDHVCAHLYAVALVQDADPPTYIATDRQIASSTAEDQYPAVGLVVSGGHSNLYEVESPTQMRLLGRSIDDAVGEAFDKAAVILQLGYPGGQNIDRFAQRGDPTSFDLPRSLLGSDSLDFSFSGLKTALLYTVRGKPHRRGGRPAFDRSAEDLSDPQRADLAASFQTAAVDTLIIKLGRAVDWLCSQGRPVRSVIIGGGVSANSLLRRRVVELGQQRELNIYIPAIGFCLDNAAMIAGLGYHHWRVGPLADLSLEAVAAGII